jgi:hypothetical protein
MKRTTVTTNLIQLTRLGSVNPCTFAAAIDAAVEHSGHFGATSRTP